MQAGDTLGLYSPSGALHCYFHGGSTPEGGSLYSLTASGTPAAGQMLPTSGGESGGGFIANEAAFLQQSQTGGGGSTGGEDAGVVTAAGPTGVTAGNPAYLISGVTDYGPGTLQIEFQDLIPEGLTVRSVNAGLGNPCNIEAHSVTCGIDNNVPGLSTAVVITVVPRVAGVYANHVSVDVTTTDPNPANNTASSTLTVAAGKPSCTVPSLARTPLASAKRILSQLHCKLGKVTKAHSDKIQKGAVVKTSPKAGTYSNGTAVNLTVSSGTAGKHGRAGAGRHHQG